MMTTQPQAVFFDAAGTLIEVDGPVGEIYLRFASRHGLGEGRDAESLQKRFYELLSQAPPMAFPNCPPGELEARERRWWLDLAAATFEASPRDSRFREFFDTIYRWFATAQAWRIRNDAGEVLKTLRRRGLRLAVVSNFDSRLPSILRGLGLKAFFDSIVWSTRAGAAKPDPAIFRAALRAVGVAPPQALHVGDRLGEDYRGARQAGLRAVLLDPDGRHAQQADKRIRTLGEILPVLSDRVNHEQANHPRGP